MMSPSEREEFEDIFDNFEQFKKKIKILYINISTLYIL